MEPHNGTHPLFFLQVATKKESQDVHSGPTPRHKAKSGRMPWVKLALVSAAAGLCACQPPAVTAFHNARLGSLWCSVGSADAFSQGNPRVFSHDGAREGCGTDYLIITSEDGTVTAKVVRDVHGRMIRQLWIAPMALDELLRIEQSYPFPSEEITSLPCRGATTLPSNVRLLRWTYGPLRKPGSAEDPLLPSGVRASTWAKLAIDLDGWPANSSAEAIRVRLNGEEIAWETLLATIRNGAAVGEISVIER